MAEITNIQSHRLASQSAQRVDSTRVNGQADSSREDARASRVGSDRVELSEHSRYLSQLRAAEIRTDMVYNARSEIAGDAYLTDARIEGTIDELARDLDLLA
ncbi:MAG: hypothetical protein ACF8GE_10585 [Phycisphaerales bacterium JB043]